MCYRNACYGLAGLVSACLLLCYAQSGLGAGAIVVPRISIITRGLDRHVADMEWSPDGRHVAYAKRNTEDWYMDIWTVKPNGRGHRRLSASWPGRKGFPQKHVGCVTWHVSGKYLAFTAQNNDASGKRVDELATPGNGINCNLWITSLDGEQVWQLTHHKTSYKAPLGVLHPQFSKDGSKLFWAEPAGQYASSLADRARIWGFAWGAWRLALADFEMREGVPTLTNIKRFQPGEQPCFYETHGFSPDGTRALFCGNLKKQQPVNGMDIYALEVATGRVKRLTNTFGDWDEHAHYSPDGKQIAWISGARLNVRFGSLRAPDWQEYITTELWLMDADGSNQRRATFFNQKGHPHHEWFRRRIYAAQRVVVSDSSWSPDGKRLAVTIAFEGPNKTIGSFLVVMDVEELNRGARVTQP